MKLETKIFDIETGRFVVLMNEEDAMDLSMHTSDRVDITTASGKKQISLSIPFLETETWQEAR